MTTPLNPMDREAWEKRIGHLAVLYRNFAFAEAGLGNSRDSENECWAGYAPEKSRLVDDILTLQSQLTEALAEVERLGGIVGKVHSMAVQAHARGLGFQAQFIFDAVEKARQPK